MSNPNTPVSLEPGRIVAGKKNVWVGTSSDPLELLEVKAQAKKPCVPPIGRVARISTEPTASSVE